MRGPRGAKDLRLFKDSFEEEYYSGGIDEAQQEGKWKNEQVERGKPKREPNLDEFMKTFALVPEQRIQYSRDDTTSVELSPVLDGHEKSRSRRAKLLLELEEAVPEAPVKMVLPPAWSDA